MRARQSRSEDNLSESVDDSAGDSNAAAESLQENEAVPLNPGGSCSVTAARAKKKKKVATKSKQKSPNRTSQDCSASQLPIASELSMPSPRAPKVEAVVLSLPSPRAPEHEANVLSLPSPRAPEVGEVTRIASATANITSSTETSLGGMGGLSRKLLDILLIQNVPAELLGDVLAEGADVNQFWEKRDFADRKIRGPPLESLSPLPLAVFCGRLDLVEFLIGKGALLNRQEYSFIAGLSHVPWYGTAIHIPIAVGNLDVVRKLVELKSNLQLSSSNGATPLWQACYFGHVDILKFLMESTTTLETDLLIPGDSPDNTEVKLYPMHLAAQKGHDEIIEELHSNKAQLDCITVVPCHDGTSPTWSQNWNPLDFAIHHNQVDAVRVLVNLGADLFGSKETSSTGKRESRRGSAESMSVNKKKIYKRPADRLFAMNNDFVVAAAARGLKNSPQQVKSMTRSDLSKFLRTKGNAPRAILDAIFVQVECFTYLESASGNSAGGMRICCRNAFLQDFGWGEMNVGVGPDHDEMKQLVLKKDIKAFQEEEMLEFLRQLVPQDADKHRQDLRRVDIYQCLVADVHNDPHVLDALSSVKGDGWWTLDGVQALAELHWRKAVTYNRVMSAAQMLHVLLLILFTAVINTSESSLRLIPVCLIPLFLWNVMEEFAEVCCLGIMRYMSDTGNWAEAPRLAMEAIFIVTLMTTKLSSDDPTLEVKSDEVKDWTRCLIAICVLLHWLKLLSNLKSVPSIGYMVVPITTSFKGIIGICIVTLVYIIAFTHAYWALNRYDLWQSFLKMWSLGLLATWEFAELENQPEDEAGEQSEMGIYVRLGFLIMSFSMSIIITNIFIGVLGNGYNEALEKAWSIFLEERAEVTVYTECILNHIQDFLSIFAKKKEIHKYTYYAVEAPPKPVASTRHPEAQHLEGTGLSGKQVREIIKEEMADIKALLEQNIKLLDAANEDERQSSEQVTRASIVTYHVTGGSG